MRYSPFLLLLPALLLALPFTTVQAQSDEMPFRKNVIKVAPLGFINKARLQYEHAFGSTLSLGVTGSYYYNVFSGTKVEPFLRLYTSGKAPKGFYFQLKGSWGSYSANAYHDFHAEADDDWDWISLGSTQEAVYTSFTTKGWGVGLGYQALVGKQKRTSLDFGMGIQVNRLSKQFLNEVVEIRRKDNTLYGPDEEENFRAEWRRAWYLVHAGAVLQPTFTIGRAF